VISGILFAVPSHSQKKTLHPTRRQHKNQKKTPSHNGPHAQIVFQAGATAPIDSPPKIVIYPKLMVRDRDYGGQELNDLKSRSGANSTFSCDSGDTVVVCCCLVVLCSSNLCGVFVHLGTEVGNLTLSVPYPTMNVSVRLAEIEAQLLAELAAYWRVPPSRIEITLGRQSNGNVVATVRILTPAGGSADPESCELFEQLDEGVTNSSLDSATLLGGTTEVDAAPCRKSSFPCGSLS
jgi:hypothetical protein